MNNIRVMTLAGVAVLSACGGGGGGDAGTGVPAPPAVLMAAGDIADCRGTTAAASGAASTAAIVAAEPAATVAALGDTSYPAGAAEEYRDCYGPTWGPFLARTRPAPGNHEYGTPEAAGYFTYFGSLAGPDRRGYYAYDLGAWRVYALNSNVDAARNSPQELWLRADLAANPRRCILAYWHHPLYSSGPHGGSAKMADAWQALQAAGADLVLAGHDHTYERFAPQDHAGAADPARGMRQFVIGTGGAGLYAFGTPRPNSEARIADTLGVVRFTLREDAYQWEFIPATAAGQRDSGQAQCSP